MSKNQGSDSDLDPCDDYTTDDLHEVPEARIHHLQAAHTNRTNTEVYGNGLGLNEGLTNNLLAAFFRVSLQWHQRTNLLIGTACGTKRRQSGSDNQINLSKRMITVSSFVVRRTLWKWPALQNGLQRLFGPDAHVRSQYQRDALSLIARSRPEMSKSQAKISSMNKLNCVSDLMSDFNTGCTVLSIYIFLLTSQLLSSMIDSETWLEVETRSESWEMV